MKIAIVTQSYYPRPGGVTEHVFHTANELRKRGHRVFIITSRFGGESSPESDIIRLGRNVLVPMNGAWVNMSLGFHLGMKLRKTLARLKPDIIHTHCPLVPTLPLLALLNAPEGSKVVGTFHAAARSNYAYNMLQGYLDKMARRIDRRIAVSKAALNLAKRYFPGDYSIIPNGIDFKRFSPSAEPVQAYRDGALNILFVGRLDKRKGLKYLIKAVSILKKSTTRKIRLIIVGEKSIRRRLLPRINAEVEVVFTGVVGREILPRFYATADVFCSPAVDCESFGIVLLEAMASGIPVISTSIPGYLTLLKNRLNSLVVPPRNSTAIAEAMRELLEDPNLRCRLRENGLRFVREYSWSRVATGLEELYESALTRERLGSREIGKQEEAPIWA